MEVVISSELTHIEQRCRLIADAAGDHLAWRWDDYVGAVLAEFSVDQANHVCDILKEGFESKWDHESITEAPPDVQAIAANTGGVRPGQCLFVTDPTSAPVAYGAWWPWSDGATISIRVGLLGRGQVDLSPEIIQESLMTWFNGQE